MQQVVQLPDEPKPLKFRNFRYQERIPFVYAYFDCLVPETDERPADEAAAPPALGGRPQARVDVARTHQHPIQGAPRARLHRVAPSRT